jgi:nucleoid DNA-binding protein
MEQDTVSDILENLLSNMKSAFEKGQCVDLGADFGKFSVKFTEGYLNADSPRTPKRPRYTVVFKSANKMKKRLRAPGETSACQK